MIHQEPKGDYLLQVCTNVPCMLRGSSACMHHLEETLGVGHGETTDDGVFTLEHMECLGSCATAPMVAATRKARGNPVLRGTRNLPRTSTRSSACCARTRVSTSLERWTPGRDAERTGRGAGPYTVAGMENPYLTRRVAGPMPMPSRNTKRTMWRPDTQRPGASSGPVRPPRRTGRAGQGQRPQGPRRRRLPKQESSGASWPPTPSPATWWSTRTSPSPEPSRTGASWSTTRIN